MVKKDNEMKYGIYLPNFGDEISAKNLADLAQTAEESGWDGFFLWDHILLSKTLDVPMVDPWVALAAIATATTRIRIGTSVTPIARRRPWKLARETVTLDHLSNGRLILTVGLGEPPDAEFSHFGEEADAKIRAQKLDEGLEILTGLWTGKPFSFKGEHFNIKKTIFLPPTLQSPRIPIWVGGFWPNKPPFRRAARWDGVFPLKRGEKLEAADVLAIRAYIDDHRNGGEPYDVVISGITYSMSQSQQKENLSSLLETGMTWWLESMYSVRNSHEKLLIRIQNEPPRI
jgi:alkanesulfonate monooxygenase SsuD/methylene tetrahydromethanopterin reductase-like flavin-dependent oxidoreductase (luciferase family)